MRNLKLVLTAMLALGSLACLGANRYQPVFGDPMLEPWRWRTFPELSGLAAQCMAEGKNGTLWFGTVDGAWSYNGFVWVNHPAREMGLGGSLMTICSGGDGAIYAGSELGITRFEGGRWKHWFPAAGQRFGKIRKLAPAQDGSLWAATAWGALHHEASGWTLYTTQEIADRLRKNPVSSVARIELLPGTINLKARTNAPPSKRHDLAEVREDQNGRVWLGTEEGEILCYTPIVQPALPAAAGAAGTWMIYNELDGMVCGRGASILALRDGTIWVVFSAGSGCVNVWDGKVWRTSALKDAGVPGDGGNLLQTRDGAIWISGRYVLSAYRNGQWRSYEKPEVPVPSAHNFLLEGSDGALWIAGPNTEIQRVDYGTPRWLTLQDLNFQWESPKGEQWFLHRDGRVVVHDGGQWRSYGVEDGLMDAPVGLMGTRHGEVWAAGSQDHTAATARFDGQRWTRFVHEEFSWGVDWRAIFESSDGAMWFGAYVDTSGPKKHRNGILQYRDGKWFHHHQPGRSFQDGGGENPSTLLPSTQRPEPIGKFTCLGESRDGNIWTGRNILIFHDGRKWNHFSPTPQLRFGNIETIYTSRERDLWIGTRQFGALRYDGRAWDQFQGKNSLVANTVRSIVQTDDGSIWAATDRDVSRFDGRTWSADVLPSQLGVPHESGALKASARSLWVNRFDLNWTRRAWGKAPMVDIATCEFWTRCHRFEGPPPQTVLTAGAKEVPQPGNVSLFWSGATCWRDARESQLQFSFRLDDAPWSAYTTEQGHSFFTLPSGAHHFEVRARDRDFNVDPTPASMSFLVLPPVWRQTWFLLLTTLLAGLAAAQTLRVFFEQGRLRKTNRALAAEVNERERAEEALRKLNLDLDSRVKERTLQLEQANDELESFSYSVSHDLRAPLRRIDGFSRALMEDHADRLDEEGKEDLKIIQNATQRMGTLIDDMLMLASVTRSQLRRAPVDLSALAASVADELQKCSPGRAVEFINSPGLIASADGNLLRIVLENLLGNAWKFTGKQPTARVEFGQTANEQAPAYFVRDNGVGFDMAYAHKLFGAFQRFHTAAEFPGTGIGLATVQRIIHRHGGLVWAESTPGQGATFYFTLPG